MGYYHNSNLSATLKPDTTPEQVMAALKEVLVYAGQEEDAKQSIEAGKLEIMHGELTIDWATRGIDVTIAGEVGYSFNDSCQEFYGKLAPLVVSPFEVKDTSDGDGGNTPDYTYWGENQAQTNELEFVCAVGRAADILHPYCPEIYDVLLAQARLMKRQSINQF
jgi:hypothetical protein